MDSVPSQRAFATSMGGVPYPILGDFHPKGKVAEQFGVYNSERGLNRRSVVVIDRDGVIRLKKVYDQGIPDAREILAEVEKLK